MNILGFFRSRIRTIFRKKEERPLSDKQKSGATDNVGQASANPRNYVSERFKQLSHERWPQMYGETYAEFKASLPKLREQYNVPANRQNISWPFETPVSQEDSKRVLGIGGNKSISLFILLNVSVLLLEMKLCQEVKFQLGVTIDIVVLTLLLLAVVLVTFLPSKRL